MYILSVKEQEDEGAYAVMNEDGDKTCIYLKKKKMMRKDMLVS